MKSITGFEVSLLISKTLELKETVSLPKFEKYQTEDRDPVVRSIGNEGDTTEERGSGSVIINDIQLNSRSCTI